MGHENDFEVVKNRIIAAAQCNADAVVISKATPKLSIPKNKQYVSIESKWGHLPYIEVAKKSEIDDLNVRKINDLVTELANYLFPEFINQDRVQYFADLVLEDYEDYYWTGAWNMYINDGDDVIVRTRLNALITSMVNSAEFQLMQL